VFGGSLLLTYELGSCFTPTGSTTWRSANRWLFLWYAELCLWKAPISMGTILFRHFNHGKTILTAAMYRQYCLVMYKMCGNQTCKDGGWTERDEASWVTSHVLRKPPVNAIISGTLHKHPTTHEYWLSSTPCLIQQYHTFHPLSDTFHPLSDMFHPLSDTTVPYVPPPVWYNRQYNMNKQWVHVPHLYDIVLCVEVTVRWRLDKTCLWRWGCKPWDMCPLPSGL